MVGMGPTLESWGGAAEGGGGAAAAGASALGASATLEAPAKNTEGNNETFLTLQYKKIQIKMLNLNIFCCGHLGLI